MSSRVFSEACDEESSAEAHPLKASGEMNIIVDEMEKGKRGIT